MHWVHAVIQVKDVQNCVCVEKIVGMPCLSKMKGLSKAIKKASVHGITVVNTYMREKLTQLQSFFLVTEALPSNK